MKYLSKIISGDTFRAVFTSGAETTSPDAACYFQIMEETGVQPYALMPRINIGELTDDQSHDWTEIKRIASTFIGMRAA